MALFDKLSAEINNNSAEFQSFYKLLIMRFLYKIKVN